MDIPRLDEFLEKIRGISKRYDITVQAVDASLLAGPRHLRVAAEKALQSFERGENIARDPGIEILLYASGRRQINDAMQMGVKQGENELAVVATGPITTEALDELRGLLQEKPVSGYTPDKKERITSFFSITPLEIEAVGEDKIPLLVLERVALLDILK